MIEVEEPPDVRACSSCMRPLTWVYVHHLSRNVSVVPVDGEDRFTFRLHVCNLDQDKDRRPWKYVQTQSPETARRGAKRARAVLAAKSKTRTDGRTTS